MFVLDTDHMSLLEWGGEGSAVLRERLADVDSGGVATTIISYEEQMRGWMAYLDPPNSNWQPTNACGDIWKTTDRLRFWTLIALPQLTFNVCTVRESASERWT